MSGSQFRSDLKIIVIGTSGTGKTSFVNKWTKNIFSDTYKQQLYQNLVSKFLKTKENFIVFNYGIQLDKIKMLWLPKFLQKMPMDVQSCQMPLIFKQGKSKLKYIFINIYIFIINIAHSDGKDLQMKLHHFQMEENYHVFQLKIKQIFQKEMQKMIQIFKNLPKMESFVVVSELQLKLV